MFERVAMIGPFPPFRGGISHFGESLKTAMSDRWTVDAVSFSTQYPQWLFPGASQFSEPLRASAPSPSARRLLSSVNPLTWTKTAQAVLDKQPDAVVFNYWTPFLAPAYGQVAKHLSKHLSGPVLAICHNVIPHESHWFDRPLVRGFLARVNGVLVMSTYVKQQLNMLLPRQTCVNVHHPRYERFGDEIDQATARRRLGLKQKRVILFFGLIRSYKGLDILIEAISQLKHSLDDFVVVVAGECYGNERDYRRLIKRWDLQQQFDLRFRFVPDDCVATYFSAADIVVLPYRWASQSGVVASAFHFNRPVMVTDAGGLSEPVTDGETGYVVRVDHPNDISSRLVDFFREDRFGLMRRRIEAHKQRFCWHRFVDQMDALAHSVSARPAPGWTAASRPGV